MGKKTGIESGLSITDNKEYQRQYREKNKAKHCARSAKWQKDNPTRFKKTRDKWAKTPHGKKVLRAQHARRHARSKKLVNELKASPCMDCGIQYPPYVMDYDHRDASDKCDNISRMVAAGIVPERILSEIAKCDLICSNCHRERTHSRRHHG